MDIVLGVSMTPTTVRMVLVEGEKADGATVDHDVFGINAAEGSATSSAADQVAAAVLGTQESAAASGHHLKSIGVTWTHHSDAAALRDTLAARGVEDVMLVSATHAAAALAQAVGRAVGYGSTALLLIEKDTATLSVVQTDDGSVVKVLSRDLHDSDAMAVLTEMAAAVESAESPPQGLFIVGSGVDVGSVKAHLENLVALPVSAPEEPELALARGAALASAHAPELEASTAGLAYSQDPDGTTAGSVYPVESGRRCHPACSGGCRRRVFGRDRVFRRCRARRRTRRRAVLRRREPQAVPARRQCPDVDLRGWRCRTGDFVGGQHPPDSRSTAQPGRDAGDSEPSGAGPCARAGAGACSGRACARATPAGANHQGARAGGAASPGASAPDGVRRAARARGSSASTSGRTAAAPGAAPIPAPVIAPPILNPPVYYPPNRRSGFRRGATQTHRW